MASVGDIAGAVGGAVEGDANLEIAGVAGLGDAGPSEIAFLSSARYEALAASTRAGAVIVGREWSGACKAVLVRVADVGKACEAVLRIFAPPSPAPAPGIHPAAIVAEDAVIGAGASIGPYCVVESGVKTGRGCVIAASCYLGRGASMGDDCVLYPLVTVRERTKIGHRAIIHSGAVIGSDGYGFVPEEADGRLVIRKIPQTGIVEIGDDVEIGANVTIDRARFGGTRIGNSVKIDNLVHIAHNVKVGDYTGIVAQAGISGSVTVGSRVILYGQAGVAGHLKIGDGAVVGAQAGVTKDVAPGSFVSGYPAMPHDKAAKAHANMMRIPVLKQRVAALEKRIEDAEKRLAALSAAAGRRGKAAGK